jgi:hypothetical protein
MQRRICTSVIVLAAAWMLAGGMERSAQAQGAVQAFPRAGGAVFVTWLASPDPAVVGYNVYRRAAGQAADRAVPANPQPLTANSLVDAGPEANGLPLGQPLTYFVRAVMRDAAGNLSEGPNSGEASATPQNPTVLPSGSFFFYDINTASPGRVTVEGNVLTIQASGSDLWDSSDGQTFLAMPVSGDYQITAQILDHPEHVTDNGNDWSKTAVQIRAGLFRGDPWAAAFTSVVRDPGTFFEGHRAYVAGSNHNFSMGGPTTFDETTFPLWLRLVKQGARITAFQSLDGSDFEQIGEPQDFGSLPGVTYAGIAIAAGRDGQYTRATFDVPSLKIEPK